MSTENARSTVDWPVAAPEHSADRDPTVLALTLYRAMTAFLPGHWQHLDRLMHGLTGDERAVLAGLLERLRQSVTTVDQGPDSAVISRRPGASAPPGPAG